MNAWETALKTIAVSATSSANLKNKLLKKGFSESEVQDVLAKAKDYKFINDEAYALDLAQKELAKLRGPARIKETLLAKGVGGETASQILVRLGLDKAEARLELAKKALEKKTGLDSRPRVQARGRLRGNDGTYSPIVFYNYLIRQGFDEDTAQMVLETDVME